MTAIPSTTLSATPELDGLRQEVARIAARFGHSYYAECVAAKSKPDELWHELGRYGFIGVSLPEEYEGGGRGITELSIVCEELSRHGCPLLMLMISPAICGSIIDRHGSSQQKRRWLPDIASGESKMVFAITEPEAGSNSHRLSTRARRQRDGFLINGSKYYISGVDEAESMIVVARSDSGDMGERAELSLFVMDTDAPGLRKELIQVELKAPEQQFMVFFDDVFVPDDCLIGTEGDGLKSVFAGLNPERITGAAIANGLGLYAIDKAAAYAMERSVWGVPIGAHQGVSHPLAKAKIEIELARLMTWQAAAIYDNQGDAGAHANMAKYAAAEAGLGALDQAIQTHGGNGLATEYGLADLWGVARLLRTAPVTREMILNFVAINVLGLPRSY